MRISPAQLRLPTHRWQTPFASMVLHSEGAERTADYERAWGHKSVQLPRADDDATPASPPSTFRSAFVGHSPTYSDVLHASSVLVVGFLSIVGGEGENFAKLLQPTLAKVFDKIILSVFLRDFSLRTRYVRAFPSA